MILDQKRRLVIPIKIRKAIGLKRYDKVEIFIKDGMLSMKPFYELNFKNREFVGLPRRMDGMYRVLIPQEFCNLIGFTEKSKVYITLEDGLIVVHQN